MNTEDNLIMEVSREGDKTVVKPQGEINMENSPRFREFLLRTLKKDAENIVVNLEACSRIDMSGLATLVDFSMKVKENDRALTVCGINENAVDQASLAQIKEALNFSVDCEKSLNAENKADS